MSDSMERDKNESRTSKSMELEREGMKQQLIDMQLYESDYSFEQMEQVLQFISESKDMASDNKNAREQSLRSSNECASEQVSNFSQESEAQDRAKIEKSIYLHDSNSPDSSDLPERGARDSSISLESCSDENDTPLKQPERRPVQEREPFRSCGRPETAETSDKLLPALNHHLRRMAELWYSWNRTADSKFRWGSPIQVGSANGSSDKNRLTVSKAREAGAHDQVARACKRKLSLAASSSYDERCEPSSEEDNDKEPERSRRSNNTERFITSKKQRVQSYSAEGKAINERTNEKTDLAPSPESRTEDNDRFPLDLDDSALAGGLEQETKQVEDEEEEEPRYPRRIIPPNPRKGYSGPRKKKSSSARVLDKGREESAVNSIGERPRDEEKSTEMKPLVITNLSSRLERQCMLLKQTQAERQKKLETEREQAARKEEEERRRKEEVARKHMEEVQLRRRQREEAQKWVKEKSMKWNNVLHVKSKESKERSRTLREQEEARLAELEEENRLLQDSDMEVEEGTSNSVNCPICNKPFPSDMIETHAASCEQYNTDEEAATGMSSLRQSKPVSKKRNPARKSEILECNICSVFRTTNGIDYEDHVNSCMQRQSASQDSSTPVSIHDIPTSPIRCFRPISEQNDTEIDYRAQFASNSRTQIRPNRKRKR